jgi:hypothetical protein
VILQFPSDGNCKITVIGRLGDLAVAAEAVILFSAEDRRSSPVTGG